MAHLSCQGSLVFRDRGRLEFGTSEGGTSARWGVRARGCNVTRAPAVQAEALGDPAGALLWGQLPTTRRYIHRSWTEEAGRRGRLGYQRRQGGVGGSGNPYVDGHVAWGGLEKERE